MSQVYVRSGHAQPCCNQNIQVLSGKITAIKVELFITGVIRVNFRFLVRLCKPKRFGGDRQHYIVPNG
jgi:hypothetical protein